MSWQVLHPGLETTREAELLFATVQLHPLLQAHKHNPVQQRLTASDTHLKCGQIPEHTLPETVTHAPAAENPAAEENR